MSRMIEGHIRNNGMELFFKNGVLTVSNDNYIGEQKSINFASNLTDMLQVIQDFCDTPPGDTFRDYFPGWGEDVKTAI